MKQLTSVLVVGLVTLPLAACDDEPSVAGDASRIEFADTGTGLDAATVQEAIALLAARVAALEAENLTLRGRVVSLETGVIGYSTRFTNVEADILTAELAIGLLENKTASLTAETIEGQPAVVFTGVNVHLRNGMGSTDTKNARGNLVVGYNENSSDVRTGSHNIVVGDGHTYTEYGGFISGGNNASTAPYAAALGGVRNIASGYYAAVVGGDTNSATDGGATVCGGEQNSADGQNSAVAGGRNNQAAGLRSTVGGGASRTADATNQWVAGSLVEAN